MQLSNSAEILPRVASGREQEAASENTFFFADYQNFRTVTLIPLAQAGIDARASFLSRRIRWTPPSFPWHNRVSAWLSLRVRASDYGWCPNIDRFLYVTQLDKRLEQAYEVVREHSKTTQKYEKQCYDRKATGGRYQPGDLVWLYSPAVPKRRCPKFHRPWKGPYQVRKFLSDVTYRIQLVKSPKNSGDRRCKRRVVVLSIGSSLAARETSLRGKRQKLLSHLQTLNWLMKNPQLKMCGLLCWSKPVGLTTNLARKSQNSYEVEKSGEEGCAEMYGHLTVFDWGRSPLNKEGNSVADNTYALIWS